MRIILLLSYIAFSKHGEIAIKYKDKMTLPKRAFFKFSRSGIFFARHACNKCDTRPKKKQ